MIRKGIGTPELFFWAVGLICIGGLLKRLLML
jgi:hypothetical protein